MKKILILFHLCLTDSSYADNILVGVSGLFPVKECFTEKDGIKIIPCFGNEATCPKKYSLKKFGCKKTFQACSGSVLTAAIKVEKNKETSVKSYQHAQLSEKDGQIKFVLDKSKLDFNTLGDFISYANKNAATLPMKYTLSKDECPANE